MLSALVSKITGARDLHQLTYIHTVMCVCHAPDAFALTPIRIKGGILSCVRACATMPWRGLEPALQWLADTSFYISCER